MQKIKFFSGQNIPLEMHRAKVVQKLTLVDIDSRKQYLASAGYNQFLLKNEGIFLDMLTDSGMSAISDKQLAASMLADDAYAGSRTFFALEEKIKDIFGVEFFLPIHQGRACEHLLAKSFVKAGDIVAMNYHFTTTRAHIMQCGGSVVELNLADSLDNSSDNPFKGNFDLDKLKDLIAKVGPERMPFVRLEAGTNLIGGQPLSLENIKAVCQICKENGISIRQISRAIADQVDIIYFSARKLGFAKGGGICLRDKALYDKMTELVTLYEGFLTYGGMSITELASITQGLEETMDFDMISQGPQFIAYMVAELDKRGIPVVKPAGGLGCHLDARAFLEHVAPAEYQAGALTAAVYLASAVRSMERGTVSEERNADGSEHFADVELVRLAMPRRLFTRSQIDYAVDRIDWLYQNRALVGGLRFVKEPSVLRFFTGELAPTSDWVDKLVAKFKADFGDSL